MRDNYPVIVLQMHRRVFGERHAITIDIRLF